jgi:hypothetical protein
MGGRGKTFGLRSWSTREGLRWGYERRWWFCRDAELGRLAGDERVI